MSTKSEAARMYRITMTPREGKLEDITAQLPSIIERVLKETGQERLLTNGQLRYDMAQGGGGMMEAVLIYIVAPIVVETFTQAVLPVLIEVIQRELRVWLRMEEMTRE